jgi:hypothetical protein
LLKSGDEIALMPPFAGGWFGMMLCRYDVMMTLRMYYHNITT